MSAVREGVAGRMVEMDAESASDVASATRHCVACKTHRPVVLFAGPYARKCNECKSAPSRECPRCRVVAPSEDFMGQDICCRCRGLASPVGYRICRGSCGRLLPADAFDWAEPGKHNTGKMRKRKHNCRECIARTEAERDLRRRPKATFLVDGRWVRRCCVCKNVKDLENDFCNSRKPTRENDSLTRTRHYECKACQQVRVKEWQDWRKRTNPEGWRADRAKWAREWRKRYPQKARDHRMAYVLRRDSDPARQAEFRERARLNHRISRLRRGLPVRMMRKVSEPVNVLEREVPFSRIDNSVALAVAIRRAARRADMDMLPFCESLIRVGDTHSSGEGLERAVRRWEAGESVTFDVADRVLIRLGLLWWDVWDEVPVPLAPGERGRPVDVLAYVDAAVKYLEYVQVRRLFEGEPEQWREAA